MCVQLSKMWAKISMPHWWTTCFYALQCLEIQQTLNRCFVLENFLLRCSRPSWKKWNRNGNAENSLERILWWSAMRNSKACFGKVSPRYRCNRKKGYEGQDSQSKDLLIAPSDVAPSRWWVPGALDCTKTAVWPFPEHSGEPTIKCTDKHNS